METNNKQENQAGTGSDAERKPNLLSIADKCAVTFNGDALGELIESMDILSDMVCRIVGAKSGGADIPIAPADELARLLASVRDEVEDNGDTTKAVNTLNAAIELAFLHSPVYKDAFEIFTLDAASHLCSVSSAYQGMHELLLKCRGQSVSQETRQRTPDATGCASWSQRFGAMVARLYGSDLTAAIFNDLGGVTGDVVMDFAGKAQDEARYMLPVALDRLFSQEPDTIEIVLTLGENTRSFCSIRGDVSAGFETLIMTLDELCKPYDLAECGELSKEELKDPCVLSVNIQGDGESVTMHRQIFPGEAIDTLESFIKKTVPEEFRTGTFTEAGQATEPTVTTLNLCEYEGLDISFCRKADSDTSLEFRFERSFNGEGEDVYFNTKDINTTSFFRGGLQIPLDNKHNGKAKEDIVLSGRGEIVFLGYKGAMLFKFRYEALGDDFEGSFIVYDAKGDCVQSLAIFDS